MAQPCPCGCGQRLGFTRRGAAAGYRRAAAVEARLSTAVPAAVRQLQMPPDEAASAQRLVMDAGAVRLELLMHCHGTANPGSTNDLLTLSRGLSSMETVAAYLESAVDQ